MANILFLGMPSFGHVNPTIGLVAELTRRGHPVTYFAAETFREPLVAAGAEFRTYPVDLDMFAPRRPEALDEGSPLQRILESGPAVVADILAQVAGRAYDRLVHSAAFPFAKAMAQILGVPTIASLGIFLGLEPFLDKKRPPGFFGGAAVAEAYQRTARTLETTYGVSLPVDPMDGLFNRGDLNLVYTSHYFAGELPYFDSSYLFVGPPIHERKEPVDFPLEQLRGKRVLYISMGTVFGAHAQRLYGIFIEAFREWDGIVVLAAHKVDPATLAVPAHFIVRDYVPQNAILRCATAAITHCGMNSLNDILVHEVPFVALPLGADQPLLAARAQALGATVALDAATVTPRLLRDAVDRVIIDPAIRVGIDRINESFKAAGGYPRAVDAILAMPGRPEGNHID
jgi:MGT family glycosyltransferase